MAVGVLGIWAWDPGNHITGLQAACQRLVVADPVFPESLLEASTSGAWESWRPILAGITLLPELCLMGFEGAGNTMPVSHIPTLIC